MSSVNKLTKGLQILQKYYGEDFDISAEHDIFYGPDIEDITIEGFDEYDNEVYLDPKVSFDDARELDDLGWFIDSEVNCWATWV